MGLARRTSTSGLQPSKLRTTPPSCVICHHRQQGAAPEEVAEAADEADSAQAFAAEAAAGEVAEAAAPEHTAAETWNKPKKKLKNNMKQKFRVMLQWKKNQ